ncbi:DUF1549 domain-containing protein [Pirellulales bacterium]|nr:DUF1549 domain-containing protein [Pirellulales bacterium]
MNTLLPRLDCLRRVRVGLAYFAVIGFFKSALWLMSPVWGQAVAGDQPVDFDRQIKPILSDHCSLCHGPDAGSREAELRLDLEESARAVIEPESPEQSELYQRITAEGDDRMPPPDSKLSLSEDEISLIKRWIAEGAVWQQHWAFVAPRTCDLPKTKQSDWVNNEIDAFVLSRLEQQELAPAEAVSKEKLLRRVSFDLTGLPPTLQELDAFLADESPDAFEKVVDQLLRKDRYGERMASDWLDLARYSDTYGYQVDRDRFVWPWRDWIVRAFNEDMPYDQFITEQLAGDLLPGATDEQILATTFNRLHPQKVEGGSVEEEFRVEYVADRSQTVGMAFMGLTVECARCHDHKYDPITQKEYYQLFAFFNNIDESGLYSFFDAGAVPTPTLLLTDDKRKQQLHELQLAVTVAEQAVLDNRDAQRAGFTRWLARLTPEFKSTDVEIDGLTLAADFKLAKLNGNEIAAGPGGSQSLKMTGDDAVELDAGGFRRHQPFTIASRVKIPKDPQLLKRSVILHRSRAWTDSASRGYQLLIEAGRLSASLIHFWPGDAISVRTQEPVTTGEWLHVAFVYDGSSRAKGIRIFVDGKPQPLEMVRDNLQKTIVGSGTDHLTLGARFRDVGFKSGELADLRVYDRQLSELEIAHLSDGTSLNQYLPTPTEALSATDRDLLFDYFLSGREPSHSDRLKSLAEARANLNQEVDSITEIMVMRERQNLRPTFVLQRGAYNAPAERVQADTPAVFPPLPPGENPNRLMLARWLTSGKHPLTARVAVNHYWQLCFGNGLVRTPEDFGSQGQRPTHPQLLDWLAVDFQQHGWDVKRLLKQMVMSTTYQQSTATTREMLKLDPENKLLARVTSHRLPAEMLRDNVLATSGLLVEKIGGPPTRPYELAVSFNPSTPDEGEGLYRRSLYTYWKRTGPAPVMLTLDSAKRDVCQVKRERTSSPLASLVQLNNPQTVEAARKLAEKLLAQYGDDREKVAVGLFRTLTSRFPAAEERAILASLYDAQLKYFRNDAAASSAFLGVGASKSSTDRPAMLAAWAAVANTLYSFDECVMKR